MPLRTNQMKRIKSFEMILYNGPIQIIFWITYSLGAWKPARHRIFLEIIQLGVSVISDCLLSIKTVKAKYLLDSSSSSTYLPTADLQLYCVGFLWQLQLEQQISALGFLPETDCELELAFPFFRTKKLIFKKIYIYMIWTADVYTFFVKFSFEEFMMLEYYIKIVHSSGINTNL